MGRRQKQVGVIVGVFLITLTMMALPRSAAAWGGRHGFVQPYRSFVSRNRFRDFGHRFVRNHHQIRRIQCDRRLRHTHHGHAFRDFGHLRVLHGPGRQHLGLHQGKTVIILGR